MLTKKIFAGFIIGAFIIAAIIVGPEFIYTSSHYPPARIKAMTEQGERNNAELNKVLDSLNTLK